MILADTNLIYSLIWIIIVDYYRHMEYISQYIHYLNYMYHCRGISVVSDYEFDNLMDKLLQFEKIFPHWQFKNSPTQLVGYMEVCGNKVAHSFPMLSLYKTKSRNDIYDFLKYGNIIGELKIDGISLSIEYRNGVIYKACTRGNGLIGIDITEKIAHIKDIPLNIPYNHNIIIRGELYISVNNPLYLSKRRNITAGIINRKNNKDINHLNFYGYSLCTENGYPITNTHHESLELLTLWNFSVEPSWTKLSTVNDIDEFINNYYYIQRYVDTDGLVFKINDNVQFKQLGNTSISPRGAIAFKFQGLQKNTKLLDVVWQGGSTGKLCPVGIIEPILIDNIKISKVTLHSIKYIQDLRIGDTVCIERSGDVIPQIKYVVEKSNNNIIPLPTHCPWCHTPVITSLSNLKCPNNNCPNILIKKLIQFTKSAKIKNSGPNTLQYIINKYKIKKIQDIFKITHNINNSKPIRDIICQIHTIHLKDIIEHWPMDGVRSIYKLELYHHINNPLEYINTLPSKSKTLMLEYIDEILDIIKIKSCLH